VEASRECAAESPLCCSDVVNEGALLFRVDFKKSKI